MASGAIGEWRRSLAAPKLIAAALCGAMCLAILFSMAKWTDIRGVWDDMCYLRQAHLFQRFGLDGLNTDLARDDDKYFFNMKQPNAVPNWQDTRRAPCHTLMPASGKFVIQYPPGTGFALAAFAEGGQPKKLYMTLTGLIFLMSVAAIALARTRNAVVMCGLFGCIAIYLMINPMKSSYSAGPTAVLCAFAGFLTAFMANARDRVSRLAAIGALGFVIGLAANFRLPSLLLSSGYFLFFAVLFVRGPSLRRLLDGVTFAVFYAIAVAPTLIAQNINAGSPLATTYSAGDAVPPEFKFETLKTYATDTQGLLVILACCWIAAILLKIQSPAARQVAWLTAANIAVNSLFFLSHPIMTPYYMIPFAMLSLWSLLFAMPDLEIDRFSQSLYPARGKISDQQAHQL